MSMDSVMTVNVWGWLLAACLVVMVFCVYMTYDAHNTLNQYRSEREQDMQRYRSELSQALDRQSESLKARIDGSGVQLKQYIDIQVPLQMRNFANTPSVQINNSNRSNSNANVSQ